MMKLFPLIVIVALLGCGKPKQADKQPIIDSLSIKEEEAIEEDKCRHLFDSIEAKADTQVYEDEIDLYKTLYNKTEIRVGKSNITHTQITFNTGDLDWDKQLNAKINKMVVNDIREMDLDTIQLMDTNYNYHVDIIPQFVTNRWVTIEYYRGGYLGGATFYTYGSYKHFTKSANGKIREVAQPEIFIYDKDSSVKQRYYDMILKGLDTEINCDTFFTMAGCTDTIYPCIVFDKFYRVKLEHFIANDWYKTFYLIPTKTGLKTKNDYGDYYPSFPSGYIADIIIPYKSLKGIVKEKYLKMWMAE
jgi:hypothetical protein